MQPPGDRDHIGHRIDSLLLCALHRRTLKLSCRACPHVRLWDAVPIWWLFEKKGWSGIVREIPRRFYCGICWHQQHRKTTAPRIQIVGEAPGETPYPYPSEREWKRVVSRYRS